MNESIIGIIGAISGLIGIIVSSIVSIVTLRKTLWNDHPRLRVELNRVIISNIKEEQYDIKVANIGTRAYTITITGFSIGKHTGNLFMPQPNGTAKIPYTLKPGNTCDFWVNAKDIDKEIRGKTRRKQIKIKAYVKDYVGYTFKSQSYRVILNEGRLYKTKTNIKVFYKKLVRKIIP